MRSITRYIATQITSVTLFATAVLCSAVILVQSVRLVNLIVNRGIPLSEFLLMASLMVPRFVAFVLPLALFGATLFVYQRMINDNELIVLRSAGMSQASLAKPSLLVGLGAMLVTALMSFYLMPLSEQELRVKLNKNRSQWGAALLQEGKFTTVGDSITMFVRDRNGSELFGILYHNSEDKEAPFTVMAKRGAVVNTDEGPRVVVVDGNRQTFDDGQLHFVSFERTVLDLGMSEQAAAAHWRQPEERFLPDLFFPSDDPNDQYYYTNLVAEGHSRVALPLLPMAYVAVALAFVLRAGFSRRGGNLTTLMAVGTATGILVLHLSLANTITKDLWLAPLIYANAVIPFLVGMAFLIRAPRHRRHAQTPSGAPG